jgi:hypothetical protein
MIDSSRCFKQKIQNYYHFLNSDLFRINITNDSKCGSPFEDSIQNIMEYSFYQNENFKVKCKGSKY